MVDATFFLVDFVVPAGRTIKDLEDDEIDHTFRSDDGFQPKAVTGFHLRSMVLVTQAATLSLTQSFGFP